MTRKEKKELAEKLIKNGDKRSYNEIQADIELDIWRTRFNPIPISIPKDQKPK